MSLTCRGVVTSAVCVKMCQTWPQNSVLSTCLSFLNYKKYFMHNVHTCLWYAALTTHPLYFAINRNTKEYHRTVILDSTKILPEQKLLWLPKICHNITPFLLSYCFMHLVIWYHSNPSSCHSVTLLPCYSITTTPMTCHRGHPLLTNVLPPSCYRL
jgi:hypothetical protein